MSMHTLYEHIAYVVCDKRIHELPCTYVVSVWTVMDHYGPMCVLCFVTLQVTLDKVICSLAYAALAAGLPYDVPSGESQICENLIYLYSTLSQRSAQLALRFVVCPRHWDVALMQCLVCTYCTLAWSKHLCRLARRSAIPQSACSKPRGVCGTPTCCRLCAMPRRRCWQRPVKTVSRPPAASQRAADLWLKRLGPHLCVTRHGMLARECMHGGMRYLTSLHCSRAME